MEQLDKTNRDGGLLFPYVQKCVEVYGIWPRKVEETYQASSLNDSVMVMIRELTILNNKHNILWMKSVFDSDFKKCF